MDLLKLFLTPVMLIWCLIALIWLGCRRQNRLLRHSSSLLFILYWLSTNKTVVDLISRPLEQAYPVYANQPLSHIMVLGCYHFNTTDLPLTSQLAPCSLARLSEGIRLWHQHPTATLHLSGNIRTSTQPHTQVAQQYAIAMGVLPEKIALHSEASNTKEEIELLSQHLNDEPAALVTTAMHMPRAMRWFACFNKAVIPAATDFYSRLPLSEQTWQFWVPSERSAEPLEYAIYEYAALLQQHWFMSAQAEKCPSHPKL